MSATQQSPMSSTKSALSESVGLYADLVALIGDVLFKKRLRRNEIVARLGLDRAGELAMHEDPIYAAARLFAGRSSSSVDDDAALMANYAALQKDKAWRAALNKPTARSAA
jgi:hypothetical protein